MAVMLQSGLPETLVQNAELVGSLAVIITLFLYRRVFKRWPLLSKLRRGILPFLHNEVMAREGGYAAREQRDSEFAVRLHMSLSRVHKLLRSADNVYPNNFASIKYRYIDGKKQYESSSWAIRPGGIVGKYQIHLMIYSNDDGTTDVYAHFELSPIPNPVRHYKGSPGVWSIDRGVARARDLFEQSKAVIGSYSLSE